MPLAIDPNRTAPRPRPRPGDELCLTVDRLAYGGEAVGRHQGLVVFASGAAAGETVRVRVRRVSDGMLKGMSSRLTKPRPNV